MKKYSLFLNILLILAFVSCSDNQEPIYNPDTATMKPAQFISPDAGTSYIFTAETELNPMDILIWKPADYGISTGQRHTVEIDFFGNEFKKAQVLSVTTATELRLTVKEVNAALNKIKFKNEELMKVEIRVMTEAMGGEKNDEVLARFPKLYSAPIDLMIKPFSTELLPENVYMTGDAFGNWNWNSASVVKLTPVNSNPETPSKFWAIRYLEADKSFKWSFSKSEAESFTHLDETTDEGFTVTNDKATVTTSGLYMILVQTDKKDKKITIAPAEIYGIGECFGGWGDMKLDHYAGVPNPDGTITITTATTGNIRIYAGKNSEYGDWWRREFIPDNGNITYRGNGGDPAGIQVAAGKKVTFDFNAGTSKIE